MLHCVCCSVLQLCNTSPTPPSVCVAVCCSVLQCVAVCIAACGAVCCSVLQCDAVCCSVCCIVLQCVALNRTSILKRLCIGKGSGGVSLLLKRRAFLRVHRFLCVCFLQIHNSAKAPHLQYYLFCRNTRLFCGYLGLFLCVFCKKNALLFEVCFFWWKFVALLRSHRSLYSLYSCLLRIHNFEKALQIQEYLFCGNIGGFVEI